MKNKKLNIMEEYALRSNVQATDERIKSGEVYNMDSLIGLRRMVGQIDAVITDDSGYIKNQVLADEIIIVNEQQENVIEIDDQSLTISINKNN